MNITRSIRWSLFALALLAMSGAAFAQLSVSISFAPPELPVYEQPLCPEDGYLWTPGYWAYADDADGYYWVPGTWVMAPEPGVLWTPAYWGWGNNGYVFNQGYWGEQVGFYGGVSYGYGYYGDGYQGGRWQGGQFYYNRSASNVNVTSIHNVYNTTIINNSNNRVSYNGGSGGISVRPTTQQEAISHERHIAPVAAQTQHAQEARSNPAQRASVNHGTPAVAATPKPGAFSDHAAVHAKPTGTPYNAPVNRAAVQPPANTAAPRPENNAARSDRPTPTNAPSARPNEAQPNRPEPNKPEPNRPPTTQPEPNRSPAAQPNNRPEPSRSEPTERPSTPPSSQRSQPERAAPSSEPRPAAQQPQHAQPAPAKPEPKKSQEEKPKENEKPQ